MIRILPLSEYSVRRSAAVDESALTAAKRIVEKVRAQGDRAIQTLTRRYDRVSLDDPEVPAEDLDRAGERLSERVRGAIKAAHESISRYHKNGVLRDFEIEPRRGITVGRRVVPYDRAGLYVPGGLAVYPSMVLMAAVPARVAGVKELVMCSPPGPDGSLPDAVLFAARLCEVARVFRIGGAQAIAAMALGTSTVPRCEIVVGPGNRFVTAAKRILSEEVAIDFLAGPTEILLLSDGTASPRFLAAEMVAQAEHAPDACAILVTTSDAQAEATREELETQATGAVRRKIVEAALRDHGAILLAPDLDAAVSFANRFAPEHLVIATAQPGRVLSSIRHAGSVFLGEYSPVATGDYCAGPNSILPTLGDARRASGLSANTFVKTIFYQHLSPEGLEAMSHTAITLAEVEGLEGHRRSVEIRHAR